MKKDNFLDEVYKILFKDDEWKLLSVNENGLPVRMRSAKGDILRHIYKDGKLIGFEGTGHTEEED